MNRKRETLPSPAENCRVALDRTAEAACLHVFAANLCGFSCSLGFQSLLGANIDFDLLGFGFRLFCQSDLEGPLVIVGRNLLRIHGWGQSEGPGEASILPLHATEVLFFLFLLELAFAVHGQGLVFDANIDVLLVNSRDFDLQRDVVLVFVYIHWRRKGAGGQRLILRVSIERISEKPVHPVLQSPVHPVLQSSELTNGLPTGQNGHNSIPPSNSWWFLWLPTHIRCPAKHKGSIKY